MRTARTKFNAGILARETVKPDITRPFSHLVTGVVLRAFAASKKYSNSPEAVKAGKLLASRFFKKDVYPDRNTSQYWGRVSFPFWFTDIVSALDSLSLLGFARDNPDIDKGLTWLSRRQTDDGLFELKLLRGKDKDLKFWVCLAICRLFKRFQSGTSMTS